MLPNSLTFLFKSSIFCCSNFGHLQTQESKDGIYMKIKKHFTFLIHVTFKKLLSWGWWMLNWQLRRLAYLFIAKEQGKRGQEQGSHPPRCLPNSLLSLAPLCLAIIPWGAASVGSSALPEEIPMEELTSQGRCHHPECLGDQQTHGSSTCGHMKALRNAIPKVRILLPGLCPTKQDGEGWFQGQGRKVRELGY